MLEINQTPDSPQAGNLPVSNNPHRNAIARSYYDQTYVKERESFLSDMSEAVFIKRRGAVPKSTDFSSVIELTRKMYALYERLVEINRDSNWQNLQYVGSVPQAIKSEEPVVLHDINLDVHDVKSKGVIFMLRKFYDVTLFDNIERLIQQLPSDPPIAGPINLSAPDRAKLALHTSTVTINGEQWYRGNLDPKAPFFTMFLHITAPGVNDWRFNALGHNRILNLSIPNDDFSRTLRLIHPVPDLTIPEPAVIIEKAPTVIKHRERGRPTGRSKLGQSQLKPEPEERPINQLEANFLVKHGMEMITWAESVLGRIPPLPNPQKDSATT